MRQLLALTTAITASLFAFPLLASAQNSSAAQQPQRTSVTVTLTPQQRSGALKAERKLTVPAGYAIEVYARIPHARFMAVTPDGDLLVTQPERPGHDFSSHGQSHELGIVYRVHGADGAHATVSEYVSRLRLPQGLAFHQVNGKDYVYIAESNGVVRFLYGAGHAGNKEQIVSGLPDSSSPELQGAYGHELKDITFGPDGKLYVDLGSTCNICTTDTASTPRRAAIYVYDDDGKNGRLFAQGIRNGEGLRFFPGSNDLWVTINGRDNMPDPATGKVDTAFVDDHPPDGFTRVRDGGDYGWPFCQPSQDTPAGYLNMPFVRDLDMNKDGHVDCAKMDKQSMGIQAHSAALGLEFISGAMVGSSAQTVALITLRGSWDRSTKTGYKIVYVPFGADRMPSQQRPVDLVTGWMDESGQSDWGRPADAVLGKDGSIFISDDNSGTVFRLYRTK